MNRLITRITKLERLVHVGPEAELRELSDAELERRIDELLMRASEEDVRAAAREYPDVFTCRNGGGALAGAARSTEAGQAVRARHQRTNTR